MLWNHLYMGYYLPNKQMARSLNKVNYLKVLAVFAAYPKVMMEKTQGFFKLTAKKWGLKSL